MALIQTQPADQRQIVQQAFASALAAIRGSQMTGSMYIYGRPGAWSDLETMQQRVNEYGTDAAKLFQVSGLLAQVVYLVTGELPQIMPEWVTYTINADGTVTLSGTAPAPEEVGNG